MELMVLGVERVDLLRLEETEPFAGVVVQPLPAAGRHRPGGGGPAPRGDGSGRQGHRARPAPGAFRAWPVAGGHRRPAAAGLPARLHVEPRGQQGTGPARSADPRRRAAPDALLPGARGPGAGAAQQDRQPGAERDEQGAARVLPAPAAARHPAGTGREEPRAGRGRNCSASVWRRPTCPTTSARRPSANCRGWSGCRPARRTTTSPAPTSTSCSSCPGRRRTEDQLDIAAARADPRRGPLRPEGGQGAHPRAPGRAQAQPRGQGADPLLRRALPASARRRSASPSPAPWAASSSA